MKTNLNLKISNNVKQADFMNKNNQNFAKFEKNREEREILEII